MVAGGSDQSLPDPDAASAPALVQLTSGSTGRPRGVVIPHDRLLLHLEAISTALPLAGEGAACVTWLPLHHDMGLIGGLLYPLFNAFPVHLLSPLDFRRDPGIWMRTIATTRATCTPGPPAAYAIAKRLAPRAVAEGLDLSTLACAMIGAEPIPAALLRDFSAAYAPCGFRPEAFFPVYGLAEATVAVTFPRLLAPTVVDALDRDTLERAGVARPSARSDAVEYVGVGAPLPGTELRVVAADGRACAEREVGEILVRAPTLFSGYLGEPDATAAQVHDGWLHTGDLGYLAGGSLFVTGRVKEVIIKAGQNIYPAIIEELVAAIEGVRGVAAVGVPAPEQGTELVCVVAETRLPEEEHAALAARIRHALRDRGIVADRVALVRSGRPAEDHQRQDPAPAPRRGGRFRPPVTTDLDGLTAFLATAELFSGLGADACRRLAADLVPHQVAAGEVVLREGEPAASLHLVRHGRLRVTVEGRTVGELGPGRTVGEFALLLGTPRTATVTALRDSDLLCLPAAAFHTATTRHPDLLRNLARSLAERTVAGNARAGVPIQGSPAVRTSLSSRPAPLPTTAARSSTHGGYWCDAPSGEPPKWLAPVPTEGDAATHLFALGRPATPERAAPRWSARSRRSSSRRWRRT